MVWRPQGLGCCGSQTKELEVNTLQGSHKNLKTEFHDYSMTDLPFPWLPFSHGFRYGYDCVSQHARQSQTRKLPQPREQAIPWLFHDFLGNFHIPRLFHDSNFFQDFPWPWEPWHLGLFQKLSSGGVVHIFCQTPPPPGHTWSQSPPDPQDTQVL